MALAEHRVRVNSLAFGSVLSASLKGALKENDDYREAILDNTPIGRIAHARELAEAAQFLASDASAFMTGQAVTRTWRPLWQVLAYCALLACASRFLHFALFEGRLLSFTGFVADLVILTLMGLANVQLQFHNITTFKCDGNFL